MANAKSSTARIGFAIWLDSYKVSGEFPDLDGMNRELALLGLEPVHTRSITHYQRMWSKGIRSANQYVAINRFDIVHNYDNESIYNG